MGAMAAASSPWALLLALLQVNAATRVAGLSPPGHRDALRPAVARHTGAAGDQADDGRGVSPLPTALPGADSGLASVELFRRSVVSMEQGTCGFVSGYSTPVPWTCFEFGASCVTTNTYFGCCPANSSPACVSTILSTCVDFTPSQSTTTTCSINTLCCQSASPSCYTWKFSTSATPGTTFTVFNCYTTGGTGTLLDAVTFSGSSSSTTKTSSSSASSTTTSSSPSATSTATPSGNSVNVGAIVGGVIGGLAIIGALIIFIIWLMRRRRADDGNVAGNGGSGAATAATTAAAATGGPSGPAMHQHQQHQQQWGGHTQGVSPGPDYKSTTPFTATTASPLPGHQQYHPSPMSSAAEQQHQHPGPGQQWYGQVPSQQGQYGWTPGQQQQQQQEAYPGPQGQQHQGVSEMDGSGERPPAELGPRY